MARSRGSLYGSNLTKRFKQHAHERRVEAHGMKLHDALAQADNWEAASGPYDFFAEDGTEKVYKTKKGSANSLEEAKKKGKSYDMPDYLGGQSVNVLGLGKVQIGVGIVDKYSPNNPYADKFNTTRAFHSALVESGAHNF